VSPNGKLIRIGEAAKILGVHTMTLRRWADQGKVRCYELGPGPQRERRFLRKDILALLRESDGEQRKEEDNP